MYMVQTRGGLIKIFLIIIIGVVLLAAFHVDVRAFFNNPTVAKISTSIWQVGHSLWVLVSPYLHKAWELMLQYIWTPVTDRLDFIHEATSTSVSL